MDYWNNGTEGDELGESMRSWASQYWNNGILKLVVSWLLFLSINFPGYAQIDEYISEFVNDSSFRHASISICFRDALSGEIIESYAPDMALGSASVMKLVTTAVALEKLTPEFRFPTMVGFAGDFNGSDSTLNGNIIIKGGGDPTILSEYFPDHNSDIIKKWAKSVYDAGIRQINGSVVADATIFNYHPAPGGWNWSDLGNYYGAGAHGIAVFDNMYRIHFTTGEPGTRPELKYTEPEIPGLIIDNQLISSGTRDKGYVYLEPYGNQAVIRGTIPPGQDDFVLKASIPDPPLLAANLLHNALKEKGIKISHNPTSLRLSPEIAEKLRKYPKTILITSWSPTISEIIKATNTESINMYAEQLLKYIGYKTDMKEFASKRSGINAVEDYLIYLLGGIEGLYMNDGSGLSRSNAISSSFITSLLHIMQTGYRYSDTFNNSLAEAGKNGTLEYYFKDEIFEGRLKAKSGTSTRIRNYAGYITTESGKQYCFAVLVNNFDCSASDVTRKVELLLKEALTRYR